MKGMRMVYLDIELIEFLKGLNASELVSRLLREHIDKDHLEHMSMEQLKAEKEVNRLERDFKKAAAEVRKNAS